MEKYKSFIELKYEPFYKDQTTSLFLIYKSKSQILKSNTEKSRLDQKIAENKYKNQYDYELQFISKLYVASLFSVILLLF
jgi:hypothetical protein